MRYVQFFTGSAIDATQLVEACGSDSVARLDRRHAISTSALIAHSLCRVRGYVGFELREGTTFSKAKVVRKLEKVSRL